MGFTKGPEIVTWTYTPPTGSVVVIETKMPELGNGDDDNPNQSVYPSLGGQAHTYERGPRVRTILWTFDYMNFTKRSELDRFFGRRNVNAAAKWFKVVFPASVEEVVKVGAMVGGAVIKCGSFVCGERILMDETTFYAKLMNPPLKWTEIEDGWFGLDPLELRLMGRFRPSNT